MLKNGAMVEIIQILFGSYHFGIIVPRQHSVPNTFKSVTIYPCADKQCIPSTHGLIQCQPLLGRDFPGFYHLLMEAVRGKEEKTLRLAEEAEESTPEDTTVSMLAVQTRRQDDLATTTSGAIPLDLAMMDGDLFGESRPRGKISRRRRKAQSEARTAAASTSIPKTLVEFTPFELQEAQADDDSLSTLWESAEKGEDGYVVRGQTLYHQSTDEWGSEFEQLVIPIKYSDGYGSQFPARCTSR